MPYYHPSVQVHVDQMPDRIKRLTVDKRGFPVPRFVAYVGGEPDHRLVNPMWIRPAVQGKLCWICGEPMGRYYCSIIGCMCSVNRVISEPPSHRECAEFSVKVCPFLARPHMHRRETGMPDKKMAPAGYALARNPGVTCLWVSKQYPEPFQVQMGEKGILFQLGEPVETIWYREGKLATRDQVKEAINEGLPSLYDLAIKEGPAAVDALAKMHKDALQYLPREALAAE